MSTVLQSRLMRVFAVVLALQVCLIYPFEVCYRTDPTPELDDIVNAIINDRDDATGEYTFETEATTTANTETITAKYLAAPDFPDMEKALAQDCYLWNEPVRVVFPLASTLEDAVINSRFAQCSPRAPPFPPSRSL